MAQEILTPGTKVGNFEIVEHVRKQQYTIRCGCGRLTRKIIRHMVDNVGCNACMKRKKNKHVAEPGFRT